MRTQRPPEDVLAEHTQQGLWEPGEEDWGRTGFRGVMLLWIPGLLISCKLQTQLKQAQAVERTHGLREWEHPDGGGFRHGWIKGLK